MTIIPSSRSCNHVSGVVTERRKLVQVKLVGYKKEDKPGETNAGKSVDPRNNNVKSSSLFPPKSVPGDMRRPPLTQGRLVSRGSC